MIATAATNQDLVVDLCRQFTRLTGWTLQFTPARRAVDEQQEELERDPNCRWYAAIGDGSRSIGFLHLGDFEHELAPHAQSDPNRTRLPQLESRPAPFRFGSPVKQAEFADALAAAESLAQLVRRLSEATAQLSSRNKDVSTLLNLGLAIPAQDDLAFALSQFLKAAAHLTNSRSAAFFLLDTSTSRLKLRAVYQLSRESMPFAQRELRLSSPDLRALSDCPVVVRSEHLEGDSLLPSQMRRGMVVGVQSEHVPFGTLWVYDRRAKEYTTRDMHVLQSIAAQVAAVLERSALLRGDQQQARLCRDVRAASESHSDSNLRDLPVDSRFELAARCTSCYELGGDLCEVIALSPDRTAIAVGDASGNSIPAAMIMSAVRGALLAHPAGETDVASLLTKVNNGLCRITRSHQFMSLCYGVYNAADKRFTYCNAGHPTPLLIRGPQATLLDSHGLLLGVLEDMEYPHSAIALEDGDVLVFYSDGISEAHGGPGQELFRSEGIVESVRRAAGGTAREILEAVWARVERHIGNGALGDDRTLLVLKVRERGEDE